MSEYRLSREIIRLSTATSWPKARMEWDLKEVWRQAAPQACICGQYPINEVCVLKNRYNGKTVEVGNVCVEQFLRLPSGKIFEALHRVAKDNTKALSREAIGYAHAKAWINDWERDFYVDTIRKRKLSPKQLGKRRHINEMILVRTRR